MMSHAANTHRFPRNPAAWLLLLFLAAGCASTPEDELYYAGQQQLCPSGELPSCIEKIGQRVRCFCADKDALRDLLDPEDRY